MAHEHGRRCYWDVETCGWVCRPEERVEEPRRDGAREPEPAPARPHPEPVVATP